MVKEKGTFFLDYSDMFCGLLLTFLVLQCFDRATRDIQKWIGQYWLLPNDFAFPSH